jgi:signal transduction histidine kinase
MRSPQGHLRWRLRIVLLLIFGISFLLFSATASWVFRSRLQREFDVALSLRADEIRRNISIDASGHLNLPPMRTLSHSQGGAGLFEIRQEYVQVRSITGEFMAQSRNLQNARLPFPDSEFQLLRRGEPLYKTLDQVEDRSSFWGSGSLRILSLPLLAEGKAQAILQVASPLAQLDGLASRFDRSLMLAGIPVLLLGLFVGGWMLPRMVSRPIERLLAVTSRLNFQDFSTRIPLEDDDALRDLRVMLNQLLDRLEKAFRSQERFVADASHELKTPLTILLGELEVLRKNPRSQSEYEQFLSSAYEELSRLSQIVQNLLILARADSGRALELKSEVRLDEVILDVIERLQAFARQSQVRLALTLHEPNSDPSGPPDQNARPHESWLLVQGDEGLLGSLFFNLVHNAIKYSAAGQSVGILIEAMPQGTRVAVRDDGTGIRPGELEKIFERFQRAENPSHRTVEGTGLGLAIARWIAEVHGARISVESKPAEGSTFSVFFPAGRS